MTETTQFNLISIQDVTIEFKENPGISSPQLDYSSAIGGSEAPEKGATKNTGALADLDVVGTDQIVAGAITKVKMALLSVDADIIAAGAITENKLYTGAVTADKIASNAITSAKINAGAITAGKFAAGAVTATEINVSSLSAISANIGTITSGTITGATLQTSSSSYAGVKISSSLGGLVSYGESIEIRDTSNTLYGTIGGYSGYFNLYTSGNRNMRLSAGSGKIYCNSDFGPIDGISGALLGFASQPWNTIYGGNLVSNNLYSVGSASYIRYFSSAWNISSDTKVSGSIYATGAIECQTARIKVGSYDFYPTTGAYDSSKYYLRT